MSGRAVSKPSSSSVVEGFPVLTAVRAVCREGLAAQGVGELEHVSRLLDAFLNTFSGSWAMENACWRGDSVRALTYLAARDPNCFWRPAAMWAAMRGHVHVLQWLSNWHPDRCEWTASVMDDAARCSKLAAVQWLHLNRKEGCTLRAMTSAAAAGDLQMVQWLHRNRREGCTARAMDLAAKEGHLTVVQWLHEHRREGCTTDAMDLAALRGELDMVKWLHANRAEGCTMDAMSNAAKNGHLEVVQWLHINRSEGNTGQALRATAKNGHLQVVKWLHAAIDEEEMDADLIRDAVAVATMHDHLGVAGWLQTNS